ncbi:MAG: PHP domain-containing protein [Clostridia bacterium]|nr:PHP domain-containing protein [Clostridia bacterium]
MSRFYYDLHVHSCLSPCADNDNTPYNICAMASLCGIDILALTDHNSVKNCPAFFSAARSFGIVPVAGMELTTSEDIHVVCLFETLDMALAFGEEINSRRVLIKNRPDIFGEQLILGENDELICTEEFLLPNATTVSLDEVPEVVSKYGGVCYPAHIDRDANGIIAILGTIPPTPDFSAYEIRDKENADKYVSAYSLGGKVIVIDSDSHYLTDFKDAESYLELNCDKSNEGEVIRALFAYLRGE